MAAVTQNMYVCVRVCIGTANRTHRWRGDGENGGEEVWEDNGRRVLLRVSWYTIDVYTFRYVEHKLL